MLTGLFVGAVLCTAAEPKIESGPPGMSESHKDALAKYGAAVWNLRRERLLTAAKQLEAVAKQDPDANAPRKELARLYAQIGREAEAIRVARTVVEKDPDDTDTAVLLARLLFDSGELKEAVKVARLAAQSKSLAAQPEKAVRVYRELALLCERADDFAVAEAALRAAVELLTDRRADVIASKAFTPKEADVEAAECYEYLGKVLVKRGKHDQAAEAFEAAAKLYADPKKVNDPESAARLAWNLSGALEAKGDNTAALRHLERFLQFQPRAAEPYQRYAKLLRALSREDEIVPALQALVDRDKAEQAKAERTEREKRDKGEPVKWVRTLNYPLWAVLGAEMARQDMLRAADDLFAKITSEVADPAVYAVIVKSHVETKRALEIIKDVDRAFKALDDKDKDKEKKPEPSSAEAAKLAAAKKFAGEKARAYAEALRLRPEAVEPLLRAASEDMRAGTERAPGTASFLGTLAARKSETLELARLQFKQAIRGPGETKNDAYRALFQVLWQMNKIDEIATECKNALAQPEIFRADVFFNYHLSRALAHQGKADEALDAADKAVRQAGASNRLVVRTNRHNVLCVLGKWDAAIEYGKQILDEFDSKEDRTQIQYEQALAYAGAKKHTEAEKLLRAILDDDPDHAGACNNLGFQLAEQGRNLDEAERLIRHAIEADRIDRRKAGRTEPESASFRDSLGWVLFRQGKLAEARVELEKAVAMPGGEMHAEIWDHLGDVLFRLDDKPGAKAAWQKAKGLYEADARTSARARRDGRLEEVRRKLARVP